MATAKKLPSGAYRCLIFIGKDANGKRQYKSFTAGTKKEAEYLASQYLIEADQKKKQKSERLFCDELESYITGKEAVLSPSTIKGYKNIQRMLKRDYRFRTWSRMIYRSSLTISQRINRQRRYGITTDLFQP